MVEGGGFEPPKAEPTDLQSAPFDRSGTPPRSSNGQFSLFRPRSSRFFGQISQPLADFPSAWSPQRDSNPRPADSYPLLLSQPPGIGVWGLDFLFTMPRPSRLGVGGWCKVSTLAPALFSPVSQCCGASTGLPFCPLFRQRGFPRFSHLH